MHCCHRGIWATSVFLISTQYCLGRSATRQRSLGKEKRICFQIKEQYRKRHSSVGFVLRLWSEGGSTYPLVEMRSSSQNEMANPPTCLPPTARRSALRCRAPHVLRRRSDAAERSHVKLVSVVAQPLTANARSSLFAVAFEQPTCQAPVPQSLNCC